MKRVTILNRLRSLAGASLLLTAAMLANANTLTSCSFSPSPLVFPPGGSANLTIYFTQATDALAGVCEYGNGAVVGTCSVSGFSDPSPITAAVPWALVASGYTSYGLGTPTQELCSVQLVVGSAASVPTVSQWGVVVLAVLTGLAGFAGFRRRQG